MRTGGGAARRHAALLALLVLALLAAPAAAAPGRSVAAPTPAAAADAVRGMVVGAAQGGVDLLAAATGARPRAAPPTLTEAEATSLARADPKIAGWIKDHRPTRVAAVLDPQKSAWTVDFIRKDGKGVEYIDAQAFISDATGELTETRVGPQVAWQMARGYEGAFGRAINRWRVWIPLCVVFLVPLLRFRRLVSWRTLDLLALLGFTVSLAWFNEGDVFTSVPLQYPPLVYLGARLLWIGLARGRAARATEALPAAVPAPAPPSRPGLRGWCPTWMLVTLAILALALRFGLNAFDSNVIDVGYAGVIGADRIAHGQTPYGTFPSDCGRCDTYGPLTYLADVPFELVYPYDGTAAELSAAHGAASLFDLLSLAGMAVLGWQLGGRRLAAALGLAWAAFPFTAYTLESNSNDSLVAAALVWGLVLARRPLGRGLMLGFAVAAKLFPLLLVPIWLRHPFPRAGGRRRRAALFVGGMALATAATGWVLLLDGLDGVRSFWSRTIAYQVGRDSPFSIWGQHPGLRPLHIALMAIVAAGALALLRWPRRLDMLQFAALSGALMVGFELCLTHWFYLYIPWFLPFALVALVPDWPPAPRAAAEAAARPAGALPRAPEPAPA
ncbi:MAG: hypothetical protein QOK40_1539 [Miltoncostaeaceae bacterium]|nr:hypothetical protein [Miltoncostaeaceae bacterium]